jgi:hypothetical protein
MMMKMYLPKEERRWQPGGYPRGRRFVESSGPFDLLLPWINLVV